MRIEDQRKLGCIFVVVLPVIFWGTAVKKTEVLSNPKIFALWNLIKETPDKPILLMAAIAGVIAGFLVAWAILQAYKTPFEGQQFKRFLRGTEIVSPGSFARRCRERGKKQLDIAGFPMPTKAESTHLLVQGATGTGKSVLFRGAIFSAMKRGNRLIISDPNGDMLAKFWREGDVILNPYDERGMGWSFFNEIRNDYDFERFALSLVPRGENTEAEEWASYARLLLAETARKLYLLGQADIRKLFQWTTIEEPDDLKKFLSGTAAESLFVGADRALASARFVLSAKLPAHIKMPVGDFSLRDWLADDNGGNLFITWREDQGPALRPLISAWVDVLCTSILSMPEDPDRRIVMSLDELDSLEKLASLEAALTKGRKHGLFIMAAIQSTAQLDRTYGQHEAQTLRSCFRSLAVLGGSRTDHKTCEDMSKSLGEHEVIRWRRSETDAEKSSVNSAEETKPETVVKASQIAGMKDLTAYISFAGMREITKITFKPTSYKNRVKSFDERYV